MQVECRELDQEIGREQNETSVLTMQEARQERLLLQLYLFTAVIGLVDAVSCIGLGHIVTATMTGNIVLLGFAFSSVPGLCASRSLTAPTSDSSRCILSWCGDP